MGLNALSNDVEERQRLYELMRANATLTESAITHFDAIAETCLNKVRGNVGCLINLFKLAHLDLSQLFNHDDNHDVEHEQHPTVEPPTRFVDSKFTMEQFKQMTFETVDELIDSMRLCVAVNLRGGFIVRFNKGIEITDLSTLCQSHGRDYEFVVDSEKHQTKRLNTNQILRNNNLLQRFDSFDDVELCSNNDRVFSLWQPPAAPANIEQDNDPNLVDDFISYYMNSVTYTEPFIDFIDTLSYVLQHPEAIAPVKFHVFVGEGRDGKTLFISMIDDVFGGGDYTLIGSQSQFTVDPYNDWQANNRFYWMEEVNDYDPERLGNFIKMMTSPKKAIRGMHKALKRGNINKSVGGMNCNLANLAGLTNADKATKSRLVIIEFKSRGTDKNEAADAISDRIKANHDIFVFKLYQYLLNRQISATYTTERYSGVEKDHYFEKQNMESAGTVGRWLRDAWLENPNETNSLIKQATIRGQEVYYIDESDGSKHYRNYIKESDIKYKVKLDWKTELVDRLKWQRVRRGTQRVRCLTIPKDAFETFVDAESKQSVDVVDASDFIEGFN